MNTTQTIAIIMIIAMTSCTSENNYIKIKNDKVRYKLEELEQKGNKQLSFFLREDNRKKSILVIANHNLGKCDIYRGSGKYKSMEIQLFSEKLELTEDYQDIFIFPSQGQCVPIDTDIEVAPDSDMIYEYAITKNGLIELGKW